MGPYVDTLRQKLSQHVFPGDADKYFVNLKKQENF